MRALAPWAAVAALAACGNKVIVGTTGSGGSITATTGSAPSSGSGGSTGSSGSGGSTTATTGSAGSCTTESDWCTGKCSYFLATGNVCPDAPAPSEAAYLAILDCACGPCGSECTASICNDYPFDATCAACLMASCNAAYQTCMSN